MLVAWVGGRDQLYTHCTRSKILLTLQVEAQSNMLVAWVGGRDQLYTHYTICNICTCGRLRTSPTCWLPGWVAGISCTHTLQVVTFAHAAGGEPVQHAGCLGGWQGRSDGGQFDKRPDQGKLWKPCQVRQLILKEGTANLMRGQQTDS